MKINKLYRYTRYWADGSVCDRAFYQDIETPTRLKERWKDTKVYNFIEIKEIIVDINDYTYCESCDSYKENEDVGLFNDYYTCVDCIENGDF